MLQVEPLGFDAALGEQVSDVMQAERKSDSHTASAMISAGKRGDC